MGAEPTKRLTAAMAIRGQAFLIGIISFPGDVTGWASMARPSILALHDPRERLLVASFFNAGDEQESVAPYRDLRSLAHSCKFKRSPRPVDCCLMGVLRGRHLTGHVLVRVVHSRGADPEEDLEAEL